VQDPEFNPQSCQKEKWRYRTHILKKKTVLFHPYILSEGYFYEVPYEIDKYNQHRTGYMKILIFFIIYVPFFWSNSWYCIKIDNISAYYFIFYGDTQHQVIVNGAEWWWKDLSYTVKRNKKNYMGKMTD
jgi:hypothetical protein